MTNKFFTGIRKGQKEFGGDISAIINLALLSLVYFLGVGMTFIIAKFGGKKFLDLEIDKNVESYWEELNLSKKKMEDYYRQF